MKKIPFIEVSQPIGTFYLTKLSANDLSKLVEITPRSADDFAVQRDESVSRINEIAKYCDDPDATFPTPIIISVFENFTVKVEDNFFLLDYTDGQKIGEVIDGQHRLKGIVKSNNLSAFELPVVLMFSLTDEEKAYVFSIINSKQTKVSMSLIYDLFALSACRSPQKTAHEIARALNKSPDSALQNRMKMLGKKADGQDLATLSQGTFVKYLLPLLAKKPDEDFAKSKKGEILEKTEGLPLRDYFLENSDQIIYKVLLNMFNALKEVFPQYWENPSNNILWKTTGFGAIMKSFNQMYFLGSQNQDLSREHFAKCFNCLKMELALQNKLLTSEFFPSNAQQLGRLSELLIIALEKHYT